MARRKRRSSGTRKRSVASAKRSAGAFVRKSNAVGMMKEAALAIAGGTVAGLLVNKLPVKDARIKAAIPIAAGIALSGTMGQKNKMIAGVAQGMVILGSVGLFKSLAPNVPFLAGEAAVPYIPYGVPYSPDQLSSMTPEQVGYMGENVSLGENVNLGYYSPADIS